MDQDIIIKVATPADKIYSKIISDEIETSAAARGTGIAKRPPEYIEQKIDEGKGVIAVTPDGIWVGFCYIETWGHGEYVANSGLIVSPAFRKSGVAKSIKKRIFDLSREKYPEAKIFGLTTGLAVMKINSDLGYEPVTYSELTQDDAFWAGCKSCVNYEILMSKDRKNCMCTAMLYDPKDHYKPEETKEFFEKNKSGLERLVRFKEWKLLRPFIKKDKIGNGNGTTPKKLSVVRKAAVDLHALIIDYSERFKKFSEEEWMSKPDPKKWSKKEILGHLVDSAQNNIRRFIVGQYENNPHIVYYQDHWVTLQNYQHHSTNELIQLWQLLNKHICFILESMPKESYERLCNTGEEKEELHTLEFLAKDYVDHHLHHLKQIFPN